MYPVEFPKPKRAQCSRWQISLWNVSALDQPRQDISGSIRNRAVLSMGCTSEITTHFENLVKVRQSSCSCWWTYFPLRFHSRRLKLSSFGLTFKSFKATTSGVGGKGVRWSRVSERIEGLPMRLDLPVKRFPKLSYLDLRYRRIVIFVFQIPISSWWDCEKANWSSILACSLLALPAPPRSTKIAIRIYSM